MASPPIFYGEGVYLDGFQKKIALRASLHTRPKQ